MLKFVFCAFFLVNLASAISPDSWVCQNGGSAIDLSQGNKIYFPSQDVPTTKYVSPQNCQWTFTVPPGKYAETVVNLGLNSNDTFFINGVNYNHGCAKSGGDIPNGGQAKLYIPAGNYTMSLVSTPSGLMNGTFSFTIQTLNLPTNYISTSIDTAINKQQLKALGTMRKGIFVLNPIDQYTIRTMTSNCKGPDYRYDTCLVYKGNVTAGGQFVAGLSSLMNGIPPKMNGFYTVLCFDDVLPNGGFMLVTPSPNIHPTDTWQVTTGCTQFPFSSTVFQSAYVTDYCTSDCTKYVENVALTKSDSSYNFAMYTGCIGAVFNLLEVYSSSDVNYLPQQINGGQWKTFAFTSGTGTMILDTNSASWGLAYERKGFFATPNYNLVNTVQNATTTLKAEKQYAYRYWVTNINDGTLTVTIDTGSGTQYQDVIKNSTIGSLKLVTVNGYGITFDYKTTGPLPSRGVQAKFQIDQVSASVTCSFLAVVAALLVWMS